MRQAATILGLYVFAAPFGYLLNWVGVPLAWMIGPMLFTAALVGSGLFARLVPTTTRPFGQIVVATFVGAHFSPEAFHALRETAPVVLGLCVVTLVSALVVAHVLTRVFKTDPVTAVLSVMPTSPVEASILAEAHGVSPTPIIFAQITRVAMVVLLVPLMLFLADHGPVQTPPLPVSAGPAAQGGLWIMLGGAFAGVAVFKVFRLTNPYFLGPLFASSALAAWGYQTYAMPIAVLYLAQLILGTWLGSCFRPSLWRSGDHVLASVLLSSALLLLLCSIGAVLMSLVVEIPLATLLLGAAPGGVTEMALTAGILGLDVALVTVIHLTRIFFIMPNIGRIVQLKKGRHAV